MNRSLISVFLLSMYFIAWIKPVYPLLNYQLHKHYIASVLCEKKDVPDNTCQGKCHLIKQLKAASPTEKNESKPQMPKINLDDYPVFTLNNAQFCKTEKKNHKLLHSNSMTYCFLYSKAIFHPPKLYFHIH